MALASDFKWEDKDTDEINSIDSEELHETRPNRWTGPASTWRNYTHQERSTYQALEGVQSRNLSIHLYNAFALNKNFKEEGAIDEPEGQNREYFPSPSSVSVSTRTSRADDEDMEEGNDGKRKRKRWQIGRKWVAWPLPANEVPDAGFMNTTDDGDEHLTIRRGSPSLVSRELEDEVSATILRLAKEKFLRRDFTREPPATELGAAGTDAMKPESQEPMELDVDEGWSVAEGSRFVTDEAASAQEESTRMDHTAYMKQAEQQPKGKIPIGGVPVPSSNDDLSYKIIHPSARNIIERLDSTLSILHNSRVTGTTFYSDSSAGNTDEEFIALSDSENKEKRKRRNLTFPEHDASQDEAEFDGEKKKNKSKVDKNKPWKAGAQYPKGYIPQELYTKKKIRDWSLRDWRDILGAASLAGFSPGVISRATQRCANLFGEEMTIHTFPEVPANSASARGKTRTYKPGAVLDSSAEESDAESRSRRFRRRRHHPHSLGAHTKGQRWSPAESRRSKTPVDGLHFCPHPGCPRAHQGFDRPSNLKRHVKEVHGGKAQTAPEAGPSPAEVIPTIEAPVAVEPRETAEVKGRHLCPHPTCPRAKCGFDRRGNLSRHIKDHHGGNFQPEKQPGNKAQPEQLLGGKSQPQGKHPPGAAPIPTANGLLADRTHPCPHPTCPRATRGFDRLANLNRHIKTLHEGKLKPDDSPPRAVSEHSAGESEGTSQYSRSRRSTPGALHFCPYPECKRASLGFDRRPNLVRHLELIHGETRDSHSDSDIDSMEEMDGAVHVDGFLRPIRIRRGQRGSDFASRSPMSRTPRSVLSRASTPGPPLSSEMSDDEEEETEDGDEEEEFEEDGESEKEGGHEFIEREAGGS